MCNILSQKVEVYIKEFYSLPLNGACKRRGGAASIAIDNNCKLRDAPVEKLHEELTRQGVHFVRRPVYAAGKSDEIALSVFCELFD